METKVIWQRIVNLQQLTRPDAQSHKDLKNGQNLKLQQFSLPGKVKQETEANSELFRKIQKHFPALFPQFQTCFWFWSVFHDVSTICRFPEAGICRSLAYHDSLNKTDELKAKFWLCVRT